jgi:hypothetical protein
MCYQASALQEKCKLAEIAIRMKSGVEQERFISEQIELLRNSSADAFHRNVRHYIDVHYAPILERIEKVTDARKIPLLSGNTAEETENIYRRKSAILESLIADMHENNFLTECTKHFASQERHLIMLGETPDTGARFHDRRRTMELR